MLIPLMVLGVGKTERSSVFLIYDLIERADIRPYGRAVMPLPDLVKIVRKNISKTQHNALGNGVICLKGGNLEAETRPFRRAVEVSAISCWFSEEWFKEKNVVYLPL